MIPPPLHTADIAEQPDSAPGASRARRTLSVRAGRVVRQDARHGSEPASRIGETTTRAVVAPSTSAVPLKRLTAGRKEINIAHDGATYLLRITKSNKLILTKAEAASASKAVSNT